MDGRWYYVEPKGTAIESGAKDLNTLEMQMDMMALNPVTGTHRQYVPQNERDIQETRVHSVVHDMAIQCQDSVEKAVRFMGQWSGKDYSQVQVIMNTEFSNTKDRLEEVKALVSIYEKKGLTRETLLREVYNRSLLGDDFNLLGEVAALAAIDAALLAAGKDPAAALGEGGKPPEEQEEPKEKEPLADFPAGQTRPKRQI